ncbi:MAG: glutamate synthase-related protein [Acidobacteriota bacterium]
MLQLEGRTCLVVGGGGVALRKVEGLLQERARVRVVAPEPIEPVIELARQGRIELELFAATSDHEANQQVYEDAQQAGVWVNTADDPERCAFHLPARIQRGDLQITISSGGTAPFAVRRLRQAFERIFGAEWTEWMAAAGRFRRRIRTGKREGAEELALFDRFFDSTVDEERLIVRLPGSKETNAWLQEDEPEVPDGSLAEENPAEEIGEQPRGFVSLVGAGPGDAGLLTVKGYRRLPQPNGGEGDFRWPTALLLATQQQARTGKPPTPDLEYRVGASEGGFDRLAFRFELDTDPGQPLSADPEKFDLRLPLNRRDPSRPERVLPLPWYGAGMSYGSVGMPVMLARARAAKTLGTLTSTGEGGYPQALEPFADSIITQVATGLFGVSEASIQRAPVVEIKYAQGAKPGLGGHLLGNKNTSSVARLREAVEGTSLFSPFPFHSVYSVEDHKKHVDWLKQVNPQALISVKVSTPTDVDMVAVGSYYAGAHIVHLDGAYGGTGAAPEIAKKNIAMPIEYALPKVHRFLSEEGIRDEVTLMASGGLRSAWDVAKAIALGADGAILGTAELVAIGCIRIAQCEKGLGCPFGITTTDPEHAKKIDAAVGFQQIVNMYTSWLWQLAGILEILGMRSISELRGRSDLLVYLT